MKRTRGDQGGRTMAKRSRAPAARLYRTPARGSFKGDKIHSFQRALMIHHNITDAPLQNNGAAFTLNSLPNYTEFTGLFDVPHPQGGGHLYLRQGYSLSRRCCSGQHFDAKPVGLHRLRRRYSLATEGDWSQIEGAKYKQLDRPVT